MKKLLFIPILFLTLFAYVNNVKADTYYPVDYSLSNVSFNNYSYSDMKDYYNSHSAIFLEALNNFLNIYSDYSSTYPYYTMEVHLSNPSDNNMSFRFHLNSSIPTLTLPSINNPIRSYFTFDAILYCNYTYNTNNLSCDPITTGSYSDLMIDSNNSESYLSAYINFFSNYSLKYNNSTGVEIGYSSSNPSIVREWLASDNDSIPSIYEFFDLSFYDEFIPSDYVEVDLNSYDYIILTLKDYQQPKFTSILQVQGSLCITPVYNYGMTPKSDYFQNYKTQACTLYYDNFTPSPLYILSSDLQNNAVYYIKSPDTSLPNKIKYDSSKFNLFTFTESTASNPSISINGRTYSPIPYSDLTDTAIISTDEGYISGQVCAIGDIECSASATGVDISNLFTHPLELLKTLWGSITTVFTTITTFITILPPTLQTFLYVSFMLIVILGILKYLL